MTPREFWAVWIIGAVFAFGLGLLVTGKNIYLVAALMLGDLVLIHTATRKDHR